MSMRGPSGCRRAKVLVADDDPAIRGMLDRVLQQAGFEVELQPDGRLRGVDLSTVDILITDVFMPERDGLELLTQLRKDAPHVRTIAMTGDPDFRGIDMLHLARSLHADVTLKKPFSVEAVLQACRSLLATPRAATTR